MNFQFYVWNSEVNKIDCNSQTKTTETKLHILKKRQFDHNSDILSAAISESQIEIEDFSAFEKFLQMKCRMK